ncbi:MAG: putative metal-binding motif-containing protein [Patescibacteria group bacterium]|nr:putative metal-binding motif-containing protein [Patescibacteria group bacterium]MBU2509651.1 putative metal-binding motif-containing protein [Patescibacteria group bacterium]
MSARQISLTVFMLLMCNCGFNPQPEPPAENQEDASVSPGQMDRDGDGFTENTGDCDDLDNDVHPAAVETCNLEDDNCDGQIDEGNPQGDWICYTGIPGICTQGVSECKNGMIICIPDMYPQTEVCDGVDNDCDGQTDEGSADTNQPCNTKKPGICSVGTSKCQEGSLICVQTIQSVQETCNGKDDDCDGQTDEYLGTATCGLGECKVTLPLCANGIPQTCKPKPPSVEKCNGKDDDCDGQTDENNPGGDQFCNTGSPGICAQGHTECQNGSLNCIQDMQSNTETCNNQDDDCDGQTDEENAVGCTIFYFDGDNDGYGTFEAKCLCGSSGNYTATQSGDCQDQNGQIHPKAPEICDGIADNNCDNIKDPSESDNDGDGYTECQNDCNDGSLYVRPGLFELCDAIDNNCNNAVDEGCNTSLQIKSLPVSNKGVLRGLFSGGSPGDSGRSHLGEVDKATGLFHYFYKFYWNLDSGESVKNGAPSIADTAQAVWNSGRLPLLDLRVNTFAGQYPYHYLSKAHLDRLRQFSYWIRDEYSGEIAIAVLPEMNLEYSPYCNPNWSKTQCVTAFKDAFVFAANLLIRAAPGRIHVGLNYNMRFYGNGGAGAKYIDWKTDRVYYNWVGYNVFVHACKNGKRETNDIWFLKAAMMEKETNNNFHDQFCANAPCIIAETAASNSCSAGYQNWWMDRFAAGNNPGYPYLNQHLPWIDGYIWFHQNNLPLGGWEEDWRIANYGYYVSIFGNSYFVNKP